MTDIVRPHPDGAVIAVRVVPGASAAKVVGPHGGELKVKVCSPPLDGRANEELLGVVAAALGLRSREVSLLSGHTARSKQVLVGLPAEEVQRRLAGIIGPLGAAER